MKLKKLAALLMAAVLALGTAACASKDALYIATVDGQSIPSGVYLTYLLDAYNAAYSEIPDAPEDILKQKIGDIPASDWITNHADEKLRDYVAVEKQFDVQGLTIDDLTASMLDQQGQYQWQMYGSLYENNGISYESFLKVLTNSYKESALFQAEYGPEGKTPVSEEDIKAEFLANYFRARYITASLLDPSTGEPLPEDAKQKATEKLNAVLAAATAEGGNFADAILASEKEQAVAEGREESSVHAHDETTHVYYLEKANYPDDFNAQVEAMGVGELKLITTETAAYLIQKVDVNEKPEDLEDYRSSLLYSLKGDAFTAEKAAWAEGLDIQYVQESKNLYKPNKLKFQ